VLTGGRNGPSGTQKQGIAVAITEITEIDDVGAERETRRRRMKSGGTQSVDWRA
jgi:hypothetical protein